MDKKSLEYDGVVCGKEIVRKLWCQGTQARKCDNKHSVLETVL